MTKDELERIRQRNEDSWCDACDCGYGDIDALLAELDRHLCQCGHWMREHSVEWSWEPTPPECGVCTCGEFEPTKTQ